MIELILAFLVLVLAIISFVLYRRMTELERDFSDLKSSKQSMSTRYGQISEQWLPLMKDFPYDPKQFRFLGSPIDGVAFSEDKIVFCEFKFSKSQLTQKQRAIRDLVKAGKVEWKEFRVE